MREIYVPSEKDGHPLAYHYSNIRVAIIRGNEPDFRFLQAGMPVQLLHDPDNKYDNNAVMLIANGIRIGYLYKGKIQNMVNDFLRYGWPIISHIESIDRENRVIEIFLGFYRSATSNEMTFSPSEISRPQFVSIERQQPPQAPPISLPNQYAVQYSQPTLYNEQQQYQPANNQLYPPQTYLQQYAQQPSMDRPAQPYPQQQYYQPMQQYPQAQSTSGLVCRRCNSQNISVQVVQVSGKSRTRGRGILWGIGRFFLILCTCGLWLLVGRSKGKTKTKFLNESMAVCQHCGYRWKVA